MAKHIELGKEGEKEAVDFLTQSGYTILEQNWTTGKFEVDLIAFKNDVVTLIEVKTRSERQVHPDEVLTRDKVHFLREAADRFMETYPHEHECRIDLIVVQTKADKIKIDHYENAIEPF